jgi:drug/metabolite transporter (DMT)-like permease
MLVYAFTGLLFWESLKHKSFGVVGLLWHVMMALLTLVISIVIFNDTYTKKDVIGFGFGLVSLALLLSNHHH